MRLLLPLMIALLVSGCSLTDEGTSPQQTLVHPSTTAAGKPQPAKRVPDPHLGQYVTSFSSTGRWIYCVRDPELPKRLTGVDEWEYYPTVEAAQRRRPGFQLFRPCRIDWPNPAKSAR